MMHVLLIVYIRLNKKHISNLFNGNKSKMSQAFSEVQSFNPALRMIHVCFVFKFSPNPHCFKTMAKAVAME
jgi:hypothetical protein